MHRFPSVTHYLLVMNGTAILLISSLLFYFYADIRKFERTAEEAILEFENYEKEAWNDIQILMISMNSREKRTVHEKSRRQDDMKYIVRLPSPPSFKPTDCPPGPRGPPGRPGIDGEPGTDGLPGRNFNYMELLTQHCILCPAGPPGEPGMNGSEGIQGRKGMIGPTGRNGKAGPMGSVGAPGIAGPEGERGEDGLMGESGLIVMRKINTRGPKGPDGPPGLTGQPGIPGKTVKGLPGTPGIKGRPGMPGTSGKPGTTGKIGVPGDPGLDAAYCPCPRRSFQIQKMVEPAKEKKLSYDYYESDENTETRNKKSIWSNKRRTNYNISSYPAVDV